MTGFPGNIYGRGGKSLDPTVPDLARGQIDGCPHRCVLSYRNLAPIVCVWLLADDATSDAIPPAIILEAIQLLLAGKGILILAQRPAPEADVRTALLQSLALFTAT